MKSFWKVFVGFRLTEFEFIHDETWVDVIWKKSCASAKNFTHEIVSRTDDVLREFFKVEF